MKNHHCSTAHEVARQREQRKALDKELSLEYNVRMPSLNRRLAQGFAMLKEDE